MTASRTLAFCLVFCFCRLRLDQQTGKLTYQNPDAPVDARVRDLPSRTTPEEKVAQLESFTNKPVLPGRHVETAIEGDHLNEVGHISNFGGDPNTIMIYGQSGGGSKVTCLLGMPAAAGLIHRASVQSGGGGNIPSGEQSKEFARQVVKELGVSPKDITSLQKMEWSRLFAAGNAVMAKMNPPLRGLGGPGSAPSATPRVGWSPTVDGRIVTMRSFFDAAPQLSKNVPMLIGSVSEEGMHYSSNPTEAEWHATLAAALGDAKASALIAAMKKAHPEKSIRTLSYGVQGLSARNNVQRMAKMKYELGGAPVYQYFFTWQSPMLDGVAGAWHTAELAFCFDNTKRCEQGTGNTPQAQALAKDMATAWANFARTGNPSQPGLEWTPSDPTRGQTMVFNNDCGMVDDPEGEVRKILLS